MPVGMFRSEEGSMQVDYGTGGSIPITRSKYEENKYKPDFDKLPSEAEYWAAEKEKEALRFEWVKREVDAARAHGKIAVIVNLSGAAEAAPEDAALATIARVRPDSLSAHDWR